MTSQVKWYKLTPSWKEDYPDLTELLAALRQVSEDTTLHMTPPAFLAYGVRCYQEGMEEGVRQGQAYARLQAAAEKSP